MIEPVLLSTRVKGICMWKWLVSADHSAQAVTTALIETVKLFQLSRKGDRKWEWRWRLAGGLVMGHWGSSCLTASSFLRAYEVRSLVESFGVGQKWVTKKSSCSRKREWFGIVLSRKESSLPGEGGRVARNYCWIFWNLWSWIFQESQPVGFLFLFPRVTLRLEAVCSWVSHI